MARSLKWLLLWLMLLGRRTTWAASNSSCSSENIQIFSSDDILLSNGGLNFYRFMEFTVSYKFNESIHAVANESCVGIVVDLVIDDVRCEGVIEFADATRFYQKFQLDAVNTTHNVTLKTLQLGTCELTANLTGMVSDGQVENLAQSNLLVHVIRVESPLDLLFKVLMTTLVMFGNIAMGLKTDIKVIIETLKRPVGPAIALSVQYFVQPFIGFGLVYAFSIYPEIVAFGLFLVGCSPSGTASNFHTYLLGGDVSLAVTVTLCSTILSLAGYPLWIYTLGQVITASSPHQPSIPFQDIALTLAECVVPVVVGLVLKAIKPTVALFLLRWVVQPYLVLVILYLLTAGIYTNLYVFEVVSWQVLIAGCLLPYFGFCVGFLISVLARQSKDRRIAIMIESGLQNVYIPIFMLRQTFEQPDADLASVGPLGSMLLGPIPIYIAEIVISIRNFYGRSDKFQRIVDKFCCCCLPPSILAKICPVDEPEEDPVIEQLIRASIHERERTRSRRYSERFPFPSSSSVEDLTRPLITESMPEYGTGE